MKGVLGLKEIHRSITAALVGVGMLAVVKGIPTLRKDFYPGGGAIFTDFTFLLQISNFPMILF